MTPHPQSTRRPQTHPNEDTNDARAYLPLFTTKGFDTHTQPPLRSPPQKATRGASGAAIQVTIIFLLHENGLRQSKATKERAPYFCCFLPALFFLGPSLVVAVAYAREKDHLS